MRRSRRRRTFLPPDARRERSRGRGRRHGRIAALIAAVAAVSAMFAPSAAIAHPLGNFTINHFAALRVTPDRISLDVVIDRAEIPAFQEQQRLDADGDGLLSRAELEPERRASCPALATELVLSMNGMPVSPRPIAAGLSPTPGAGGLMTLRLVCEYEASFDAPLGGPTTVEFEDRSFAERIGWREIVVLGDGARIIGGPDAPDPDGGGISERLTAYPTDLLARPLDVRSVRFQATPGGPALAPWTAPDAQSVDEPAAPNASGGVMANPGVPGGITEDLAALIDVPDRNPLAILVALAIAFGLGVVHALSPGHGKTIMAAYLLGGGGSNRPAIGLGLAVAVSHTLGVLALAGITIAASSVVPPERLYPILGLVSGALVIVIGASLLWSRIRSLRTDAHQHDQLDAHDHPHSHDTPHAHTHPHPHRHDRPDDGISWRGLVALGLSGGLVPSASALILLLGSIAVGAPAYGLALVVAFGLGMAVVLGGIGFALVHARRLIERRPLPGRFARLSSTIQLATASLVVVLGVVLTSQALTQVR